MSQAVATSLVTEGTELMLGDQLVEAIVRFEKAIRLCPPHAPAWRGLGHALLRLGRAPEAARALDQAIGLDPERATALWAAAVAHADLGNRLVAQRYLARALVLQPSWLEMALAVPPLAALLGPAARAAQALTARFGAFSARAFHHAADDADRVEIARIAHQPEFGQWTCVTLGLAEHAWGDPARPRVELILASPDLARGAVALLAVEADVGGAILANLALHLRASGFFPTPGTVVRDVLGGLGIPGVSARLPHVYIRVPRAWPGLPLPLSDGPPAITLAQVVPVSEGEVAGWVADPASLERSLGGPVRAA